MDRDIGIQLIRVLLAILRQLKHPDTFFDDDTTEQDVRKWIDKQADSLD